MTTRVSMIPIGSDDPVRLSAKSPRGTLIFRPRHEVLTAVSLYFDRALGMGIRIPQIYVGNALGKRFQEFVRGGPLPGNLFSIYEHNGHPISSYADGHGPYIPFGPGAQFEQIYVEIELLFGWGEAPVEGVIYALDSKGVLNMRRENA